jgi:hypothetical protein
MPRENIEIVRRIYAEWERGNFEAAMDFLDDDVVFETFMPDASESVVVTGRGSTRAFTRDWLGQWENYRAIGDEFREVDENRVLVLGRQAGTGRWRAHPRALATPRERYVRPERAPLRLVQAGGGEPVRHRLVPCGGRAGGVGEVERQQPRPAARRRQDGPRLETGKGQAARPGRDDAGAGRQRRCQFRAPSLPLA